MINSCFTDLCNTAIVFITPDLYIYMLNAFKNPSNVNSYNENNKTGGIKKKTNKQLKIRGKETPTILKNAYP